MRATYPVHLILVHLIVLFILGWWLVYSCCSHLKHTASVKRLVSLQFLNLRHSVGLLGRVISSSQGRYLTETQNKHIHASSGIRTHYPSVQASEDSSCLRLRSHCDRPNYISGRVKVMMLTIMRRTDH
jgi:hypothetical protein